MNFKQFNELLNESGIRIPEGTTAAKIIHHQDFDGVFSAIITFQQLVKQGIKEENIITSWIQYGDTQSKVEQKLSKSKGQMVALVDFARIPEGVSLPDFWSDHHSSDKTQYGTSGGRTNASEFKSDSHHLSLMHTINMVDSKTIEIVNKIDSAEYTDLEEILKLPKEFKESRRLERLGILCNALLTKSGLLKNDSLLEEFIKKTSPSIVSFFNNILLYTRLDDLQKEAIKELGSKDPDWVAINKIRDIMPTDKSRNMIQPGLSESRLDDYEELQSLRNKDRTKEEEERYRELIDEPINKLRKSRAEKAKAAKGNDDFEIKRTTLIQHNARLQRYLWTQMNKAGIKFPFIIKRFATFIQIAINPELPSEVKEKIDLNVVAKEVMTNVRDKFENKYNTWAFNIISGEMGGHPGITNIPALGTLGLMKKADREELKFLKSLKDRVSKLKSYKPDLNDEDKESLDKISELLKDDDLSNINKDKYTQLKKYFKAPMRQLIPNKYEELVDLTKKKKYFAKRRTEIMDEIIEEFVKQLEDKFGTLEIPGGKKEYEFESLIKKIQKEVL